FWSKPKQSRAPATSRASAGGMRLLPPRRCRLEPGLNRLDVIIIRVAHGLDVGAHRGRGAVAVAAQNRLDHAFVLGVRPREPAEVAKLRAAERRDPRARRIGLLREIGVV